MRKTVYFAILWDTCRGSNGAYVQSVAQRESIQSYHWEATPTRHLFGFSSRKGPHTGLCQHSAV